MAGQKSLNGLTGLRETFWKIFEVFSQIIWSFVQYSPEILTCFMNNFEKLTWHLVWLYSNQSEHQLGCFVKCQSIPTTVALAGRKVGQKIYSIQMQMQMQMQMHIVSLFSQGSVDLCAVISSKSKSKPTCSHVPQSFCQRTPAGALQNVLPGHWFAFLSRQCPAATLPLILRTYQRCTEVPTLPSPARGSKARLFGYASLSFGLIPQCNCVSAPQSPPAAHTCEGNRQGRNSAVSPF